MHKLPSTVRVKLNFAESQTQEMKIKGRIVERKSCFIGPRREKTCLKGFANNTGTDQPAHPRMLISAFVIRFLESTVFNRATSKISIF